MSGPAIASVPPDAVGSSIGRWIARGLIVALLAGYVALTLYWREAGTNFIREGRLSAVPTVAAGGRLSLRAAEREPASLLWGWSPPQDDYNWTYGRVAELGFHADRQRPPRRAIVVLQDAQFPSSGGPQVVAVAIDGRPVARWTIEPGVSFPVEYAIELPSLAGALSPADGSAPPPTVLQLRPATVVVPLQLGRSGDPRQLGIAVREVRFE